MAEKVPSESDEPAPSASSTSAPLTPEYLAAVFAAAAAAAEESTRAGEEDPNVAAQQQAEAKMRAERAAEAEAEAEARFGTPAPPVPEDMRPIVATAAAAVAAMKTADAKLQAVRVAHAQSATAQTSAELEVATKAAATARTFANQMKKREAEAWTKRVSLSTSTFPPSPNRGGTRVTFGAAQVRLIPVESKLHREVAPHIAFQADCIPETLRDVEGIDTDPLGLPATWAEALRAESVVLPELLTQIDQEVPRDPNGFCFAHDAVRLGRYDVVFELLSRRLVDEDIRSRGARLSLLHVACIVGNVPLIKLLASTSADPVARSRDGVTPLMAACHWRRYEAVVALLGSCPDKCGINDLMEDNRSALYIACAAHAGPDIIKALLRAGAYPLVLTAWGRLPIHATAALASEELMTMLIGAMEQALKSELKEEDPDALTAKLVGILMTGDRYLRTPVHEALRRKNAPAAGALLRAISRADPQFTIDQAVFADQWNVSPIHLAFGIPATGALKMLTRPIAEAFKDQEVGLSKLPRDEYKRNFLHYMASSNHSENSGFLHAFRFPKAVLDAGLLERDGDGRTPLHVAVASNSRNMITYFIRCGVPLDMRDNYGKLAHELASPIIVRKERSVEPGKPILKAAETTPARPQAPVRTWVLAGKTLEHFAKTLEKVYKVRCPVESDMPYDEALKGVSAAIALAAPEQKKRTPGVIFLARK